MVPLRPLHLCPEVLDQRSLGVFKFCQLLQKFCACSMGVSISSTVDKTTEAIDERWDQSAMNLASTCTHEIQLLKIIRIWSVFSMDMLNNYRGQTGLCLVKDQ